MKHFIYIFWLSLVLVVTTVSYADNRSFVWPDKDGIPARDAFMTSHPERRKVQKGDSIWLRKAYVPILIYGEYEVQPDAGVACVENYFDLELEDLGQRLVVCNRKEAEFFGLVMSTTGGVTTLRAITAVNARALFATLHIRQDVLGVGDTLIFSGRQTYFYPNNKMKCLKMYKEDGTFDFSVEYDQVGALVSTMQKGDTLRREEYYSDGTKRTIMTSIPSTGAFSWRGYTPKGNWKEKVEVNMMENTSSGLVVKAYVTPAMPSNGYSDLVVGRQTHANMIDWIHIHWRYQMRRLAGDEPVFLPVWAQRYSREEDMHKPSPLTQYLKHKTHWLQYYREQGKNISKACYAFTVDKKNTVKDVRVLQSCGVEAFDKEIVRALKDIPICSKGGIWSRPLGEEKETYTGHDYEVRYYFVPTQEKNEATSEPFTILKPEDLSSIHAGDTVWLSELYDEHTVYGDYAEECEYNHDLIFRVAYTDMERTDQLNRMMVTSADKAHYIGIVEKAEALCTTMRVFNATANGALHSVIRVHTWSINMGDTLIMNGTQTYYYPNGEKKCVREFSEAGLYQREETYDLSGNIISGQNRKDSVLFVEYYPSGSIRQTYTYNTKKRRGRWDCYSENGKLLDTLLCTRLAPYDDGVYVEYESTPSIPAGERPDTSVEQKDYTIDRSIPIMSSWRTSMKPMSIYPVRKEGRWRDMSEKYLVPRAYFARQTRWLDYYDKEDTLTTGSYSCIVNKDGTIRDIQVEKSCGIDSFDMEIVEAIRNLPIYRPGAIVRKKAGSDTEERIPHTYKLLFYFYVYTEVEVMPQFPGGQQALFQFLKDNVKYPVEAQMNGVQGRPICQFVVDKDGSIRDVKISRTSGYAALDKEAVRVIRSMPKWSPGMQKGKAVRVRYNVPVNFKLK